MLYRPYLLKDQFLVFEKVSLKGTGHGEEEEQEELEEIHKCYIYSLSLKFLVLKILAECFRLEDVSCYQGLLKEGV